MSKFGHAPDVYDQADESRFRAAMEEATDRAFSKRKDIDLANGEKLILTASDGSKWYLVASPAGTLSLAAA